MGTHVDQEVVRLSGIVVPGKNEHCDRSRQKKREPNRGLLRMQRPACGAGRCHQSRLLHEVLRSENLDPIRLDPAEIAGNCGHDHFAPLTLGMFQRERLDPAIKPFAAHHSRFDSQPAIRPAHDRQQAAATTERDAGESRAARDNTASRTVAGTPGSSDASASVTKKGLPPVTANRSSICRPAPGHCRSVC